MARAREMVEGLLAIPATTTPFGSRNLSPVPEVLVLDLDLPRVSGLRMVERLRADELVRKAVDFVRPGRSSTGRLLAGGQ